MGSNVNYWRGGVLTPKEAAVMLDRHQRTVLRMADRGEIRWFRTPGGHRRYSLIDVIEVLERR